MASVPVTVVARIRGKPGKEAQVREELRKLLAPTRAEKGCINYDMHEGADDKTRFVFYENWVTGADLDRHLASPHIQRWIKISEGLLAEPIEITRWKKVE